MQPAHRCVEKRNCWVKSELKASVALTCGVSPYALASKMKHRAPFRFVLLVNRAASIALLTIVVAGCAGPSSAQRVPPSRERVLPSNDTLPASLRATPQEVLQDALSAVGETTYECRSDGNRLSWTLTGSDATLVDRARHSVGTVMPGHDFIAYDGSRFAGAPAGEEIVTAGALTWERLVPRDEEGAHSDHGRFAEVTSVQRVLTSGGVPPVAACSQQGQSLLVPYTATYLFYRAAQAASADTMSTATR